MRGEIILFDIFCLLDYEGCYLDKNTRDLNDAELRSGSMTIQKCIEHCSSNNFQYAGLQVRSSINYFVVGRADGLVALDGDILSFMFSQLYCESLEVIWKYEKILFNE